MPRGNPNACPTCKGFFVKDGLCLDCGGTGKDIHLNSSAVTCRHCKGTGVCQTCLGTGDKTATVVDASGRPQRTHYIWLAIAFSIFGWFAQGLPWIMAWSVAIYSGVRILTPRRSRNSN